MQRVRSIDRSTHTQVYLVLLLAPAISHGMIANAILRNIENISVSLCHQEVYAMRELLLDIFNHRSAITSMIIILATLTFGLSRGGISVVDILILGAVLAAGWVVWRLRTTSPTPEVDSLRAFQDRLRNGSRPTLIQLYSRYCAGCLAVKPTVDRLEAEAGDRLQLLRLDIDEEPGKLLLKEYGVTFTPTFIYFDKNGKKLQESTLVLDRPRILYDLESAQ
jgi:thiol-disulfide isomerase/thioredoxin